MNPRARLLSLSICMASFTLCAQDQINFTQFYLNPYILNSSFAGIEGKTAASLIYRKQWINIDGGPAIANLSVHTPVSARTSTGISVTNDQRGLLNNSSVLLTFGYNIPIKKNSFLRFGISGGGSWNTIDLKKLEGFNDRALGNLLSKHASIGGNASLSFHSHFFHVGLSLPNVFSPSYISRDGFTITEVKPFQVSVIHASNRFYFNDNKHVFEPYLVYRLNNGVPSQFEMAGLLHLNHTVWIGGSYRQDFGVSGLGGIKLKNSVAIGVSYSLKNAGMNELNSPSFEISLNYLFGSHKKGTPVYSFVDTHKEKEKKAKHNSASEAIAQKHKQDEIAKKKQQEILAKQDQQKAKTTSLQNANKPGSSQLKTGDLQTNASASSTQAKTPAVMTNTGTNVSNVKAAATHPTPETVVTKKPEDEKLIKKKQEEALAQHRAEIKKREELRKNETVVPPPAKDTLVTHNPRFKQSFVTTYGMEEGQHEHEQEQLSRLQLHADNPTEHHNEAGYPHAERHEFVKRGNHAKELLVSDYVIGGVFRSEANAKHYSDGLDKLGFDTHYGHLTEKNLWYVYVMKTEDINKARTERDKVRKMKILRDAWLLTVHH